ncbi:MAG: GTP-binding protein [Candidatus Lokiarchaeota archaeon]|nr:GTP-binding protein [Candidatus Lokiarchaeota archaeon]MCK4778751.1 GTP-binding protein [Candidatus Lokiarchaeota archaeon]TKJ18621.1 MAG: GTP-binding protein [Candidatus Lokiarchaeota archaeon Loki_b32]
MSPESQYKFKITLFGPGGVGKTSLLLRYIKDYFSNDLKKTIGSNFLIKDVELDGKSIRLLLWDIGGQPQFHKLRTIYFKGSNAALGVFDLSSSQTLLKIPGWISSIKKTVKKTIPMVLIGNKADLEREVDRLEAEDLAKRLNCEYMETSAKTGENVELVFEKIAKACLEDLTE